MVFDARDFNIELKGGANKKKKKHTRKGEYKYKDSKCSLNILTV